MMQTERTGGDALFVAGQRAVSHTLAMCADEPSAELSIRQRRGGLDVLAGVRAIVARGPLRAVSGASPARRRGPRQINPSFAGLGTPSRRRTGLRSA